MRFETAILYWEGTEKESSDRTEEKKGGSGMENSERGFRLVKGFDLLRSFNRNQAKLLQNVPVRKKAHSAPTPTPTPPPNLPGPGTHSQTEGELTRLPLAPAQWSAGRTTPLKNSGDLAARFVIQSIKNVPRFRASLLFGATLSRQHCFSTAVSTAHMDWGSGTWPPLFRVIRLASDWPWSRSGDVQTLRFQVFLSAGAKERRLGWTRATVLLRCTL